MAVYGKSYFIINTYYWHKILHKKLCYQFRFYSIPEKYVYHTQCIISNDTSSCKHATSVPLLYVLFYAFSGDVLKDCEAAFSLNYIHLTNY